ncbi:hypothetical protein FXO38_33324 [Capsicum annuum]|nr:hypothetical protein FXO38_33324 [Capsicum annuum]KAF3683963.1 hypothetical protein FXO37_01593 [Capsicum annuum]
MVIIRVEVCNASLRFPRKTMVVDSSAVSIQIGLRGMDTRNEFRLRRQTKSIIIIQVNPSVMWLATSNKFYVCEVSFFTTHASRIYVNPDIDYVRSLVQKFTTMPTKVQITERSNVNNISIEEEMILNSMDIKELFDSEWSSEILTSADISLGNLKDPEEELQVTNGAKSRIKRYPIIHDKELSIEDANRISLTFVDGDGEGNHIKVPIGMSMLEDAHENDIEFEGHLC